MTEPTTTTTAATLAAATATMPVLSIFGVSLGLRVDVLIAGFAGALVAIVLLGTVPGSMDTWRELLRTTVQRMGVVLASALLAGYVTPLLLLVSNVPASLFLAIAFVAGAGAQKILRKFVDRLAFQTEPSEAQQSKKEEGAP